MGKGIVACICLILVGISFLIMSLGCIKNKWIVFGGVLLFIIALIYFLISFKDVMFT